MNTFAPTPNPVIPDVGDEGVVMVPAPLTNVQAPAPTVAVFPANVAVVPQTVCAVPASAVVGPPVLVMVTVLVEAGHGALSIVHINTFAPVANPVTPDVGDEGVVIVPAPLTKVQVPVPTVAVFPAKVAEVLHND